MRVWVRRLPQAPFYHHQVYTVCVSVSGVNREMSTLCCVCRISMRRYTIQVWKAWASSSRLPSSSSPLPPPPHLSRGKGRCCGDCVCSAPAALAICEALKRIYGQNKLMWTEWREQAPFTVIMAPIYKILGCIYVLLLKPHLPFALSLSLSSSYLSIRLTFLPSLQAICTRNKWNVNGFSCTNRHEERWLHIFT